MKRLLIILAAALATLASAASEKMEIFSLNNSLIDFNNQPAMFNDMAAAMGKDAHWQARTQLGRTLLFHYNDPISRQSALSRPWQFIIMQEHSSLPKNHPEVLMQTIVLWKQALTEKYGADCPQIILPMNWAYNDPATFKADNELLMRSYLNVARDIPGVTICPVALAYEHIFDTSGSQALAALFTDDRHPTPAATYLAACMEYATMMGVDPETITYLPAGLDPAQAKQMRKAASAAMARWSKIMSATR